MFTLELVRYPRDETDNTQLGQLSSSVHQTYKHFVPRFFVAEHGTMFFFFQAEDGIRDSSVTGVQTCALPISADPPFGWPAPEGAKTADRISTASTVNSENCFTGNISPVRHASPGGRRRQGAKRFARNDQQ